jgi:hypothetical protein
METKWEGYIVGTFKGYAPGRVHELSDGSRWRQTDRTKEYVYRERAKARLLRDRGCGTTYLDVEGTSATAPVIPDDGTRGLSAGAY